MKLLKKIRYFDIKDKKVVSSVMDNIHINSDEYLIKVDSFGVNRADILMKNGKYSNSKKIMGLECSGYIYDINENKVSNKKVMALLDGGGYSEYVTVNKQQTIAIESEQRLGLAQWAAVPEAYLTALMLLLHSGFFESQN